MICLIVNLRGEKHTSSGFTGSVIEDATKDAERFVERVI